MSENLESKSNPWIVSNIEEVPCPLCSFKAPDLKKHMFDAHKCSSQSVFSIKHLGIKKVTKSNFINQSKTKSHKGINRTDRLIKQFGLKQAKLCLPKLSQETLAKYVANLNCPLCNFKAPDLTKHMFDVHKCLRQSVFSIKHLGIKQVKRRAINVKPKNFASKEVPKKSEVVSSSKDQSLYICDFCPQMILNSQSSLLEHMNKH